MHDRRPKEATGQEIKSGYRKAKLSQSLPSAAPTEPPTPQTVNNSKSKRLARERGRIK
jgi:hypothetical protein